MEVNSNFQKLFINTLCPFAKDAQFWLSPVWIKGSPFKENCSKITDSFQTFIAEGISQGFDAFIVEIVEENSIYSLSSWSNFLFHFLEAVHKSDRHSQRFFTDNIENMSWDFTYEGHRFFIPTFAPFYRSNHSRYSHAEHSAFIMFQPDSAFDKVGINSRTANRKELSEKVQSVFRQKGIDYDIKLVRGSLKAHRFIKPLEVGDLPIEWWKLNDDNARAL